MSLVIDCSVTLAWLLPDEAESVAQKAMNRVVESRAWVPSLWRLEVANSLLMAQKRGRIDAAFRDGSLTDLALLNIHTDPDSDRFAWSDSLRLAEGQGLTLYDAAYLELALRLSLPLATLDRDLQAAARACGVPLL